MSSRVIRVICNYSICSASLEVGQVGMFCADKLNSVQNNLIYADCTYTFSRLIPT